MKTPRFYLGLIILFWGWQMDTLFIAVGLSIILESSRWLTIKYEFKVSDFNKFVDISTVLLAGIVVVALTSDARKAILIILKWLPLVLFPMVAVQEFSTKGKIDIRSFFLTKRKRNPVSPYEASSLDISYSYAVLCMISAAGRKSDGIILYVAILFFALWALWQVRSKRASSIIWIVTISAVIITGYFGYKTIRSTSDTLSLWFMNYYADYYSVNPFKRFTAIGEIGNLKFSNKILFRVKANPKEKRSDFLLHQASYNKFVISNWFSDASFRTVDSGVNDSEWVINPSGKNRVRTMTIYSHLNRNRAVLALPPGVTRIAQMKIGVCEKNDMQVIRVKDGPSFIKGVISYTDEYEYDSSPTPFDLKIPDKEQIGIEKIVKELGLENAPQEEILVRVKNYFLSQYSYSLDLKGKENFETPVQNFLLNTKSGHCELFATSTALILRKMNIPTRYATGFFVHEFSGVENKYIVRRRDAHAWVKVFADNQWVDFDTTPPSFLTVDSDTVKTSLINDLFSFFGFKFSQFRHETGALLFERYGLWLILPLILFLIIRLRTSNKIKKVRLEIKDKTQDNQEGRIAGFKEIEEILAKKGFPRYSYETYAKWAIRIELPLSELIPANQFKEMIIIYNISRFSKSGISLETKQALDLKIGKIVSLLNSKEFKKTLGTI